MTRRISDQSFVRSILPWVLAAVFFLLYLATLNHWVTLGSLPVVAKVTGWDWRQNYITPLQHVLLWPFRFFPPSIQLISLNVFSAVCAALTLALLARSIVLLPQDRTRDQRHREHDPQSLLSLRHNWLPVSAAVALCGLQLSFWENATVASGEIIDLLVFAYVIRCLLEYRVSENDNWLSKLAFVYGLGITNNWAMINYFPIFLVAVIAVKGIRFFTLRFILRMVSFGSAGLLLYFLFPAMDAASEQPSGTFFEILKTNWRFQKTMLWQNPFARAPELRLDLFRLVLTSLLPAILISIRWPSVTGELSPTGQSLTLFMMRFMHLICLAVTLWVFFDPPFSGRVLGRGFIPFLTFYYLAALVTGYLLGYVLLVYGKKPDQSFLRFSRVFSPIARGLVVIAWLAAVACPAAVLWKNWDLLRATNGPELKRYATLMAKSIPEKNAVVLSDDTPRLFLLKAVYHGQPHENLLIETTPLQFPVYHGKLRAANPAFEKELLKPDGLPEVLPASMLVGLLDRLKEKNRIYYLHPSFGYYFERFYSRSHGLVYELKPYQADELIPPPLTAEDIRENNQFWQDLKPFLPSLPLFRDQSYNMGWLTMNYSRALTAWGVEMQRAKRLEEAAEYFTQALHLNPDNLAAFVNVKANERLRQGEANLSEEVVKEIEKKLGEYRSWESALTANGPFDGTQACVRLAQMFNSGGNPRQALALFLRTLEISPDHKAARIGAISSYLYFGKADKALEQISHLRNNAEKPDENLEYTLLELESHAHARKNDMAAAEKCLQLMQQKRPGDDQAARLLIQFYMQTQRFEDAYAVVEKQLAIKPQDEGMLLNKGAFLLHLNRYDEAIAALNEFLRLKPNNTGALMNRAVTYLKAKKYAEAKKDYETLIDLKPPRLFAVHFGLGEVASQEGRKPDALRHYEQYLQIAPTNTAEFKQVAERVQELKSPINHQ